MKLTTRKFLIVVGLLLLGIIGFRIAASVKKNRLLSQPNEQVLVVKTHTVGKGKLVDQVRISGTIRPANEIDIFPKIAGRIVSLNVDLGDFVKAGQVLAVIEHKEVALQEKSALAGAAVAQANEASAHRELVRAKKLFQESAISQAQLEGAQLKYDLARAQRQNADAQADIARQTKANAQITSLISGFITKRTVTLGSMVGTQSPIFTVQDISKLKLSTSVDASALQRLKKGTMASISLERVAQKIFSGVVTLLSPSLDAQSRRAAIEIEISEPYEGLVPNMFVDGFLILGTSTDSLIIPNKSIRGSGQDARVFKVVDQKITVVSPRLGASDENNTEVVSGLSEGDVIVISGLENLREGVVVSVE